MGLGMDGWINMEFHKMANLEQCKRLSLLTDAERNMGKFPLLLEGMATCELHLSICSKET